MSFVVSGLTDYVDENRDGLIGQVVAGGKSVNILDLQTGFKHAGAINLIDTDVVFQADACGRTVDGTTTLTQRVLTVGAIKVEEDLCPKDLNAKYTGHQLKAGSKNEEIPFEEAYTKLKVAKIVSALETAIWQGDTTSGTNNLSYFDGLIKIIDDDGNAVDGNTSSATSITSTNIVTLINDMYAAIPAALLDSAEDNQGVSDLAVMVGTDTFRTYVLKLIANNMYHHDPDTNMLEVVIPGTNVKVIGLSGLTGTNRMFAGRIGSEGDFVVGTDLEHEEETFDMWWSKDDKVVKFDASWKMGTQVKYPAQIVEFTLTA